MNEKSYMRIFYTINMEIYIQMDCVVCVRVVFPSLIETWLNFHYYLFDFHITKCANW